MSRSWSLLVMFLLTCSCIDGQKMIHAKTDQIKWLVDDAGTLSDLLPKLLTSEFVTTTEVVGLWQMEEDTLSFRPYVPLRLGYDYQVIIDGMTIDHIQISIPNDYQRLSIIDISPGEYKLPVNLIKWSIRFSRAVNLASVMNHVSLLENGVPVDRSFLQLDNVLWDKEHNLLVIWMEPGRVKTGLGPNESIGPILKHDYHYSLLVDKGVVDNNGLSMLSSVKHDFEIKSPDTVSPNLSNWSLDRYQGGFRILTDDHMDLASTIAYVNLELKDKNGWQEVIAEISISAMVIDLKIENHDPAHQYRVLIDPLIEDWAGNNLSRAFETNTHDRRAKKYSEPIYIYEEKS